MSRIFFAIFTALVIALGSAQAQIIDTEASHAVIMDHETGTILFAKNGDQPMVPASMTKIMTAFVVFDKIERGEVSLTDRLTVSEDAWRRGGFPSGTSTMGLVPKDTPTIEELLHGVIIMSGNDACIVLAQGLSGSEEAFAREMTGLAHELGLESANFVDATGLTGEGQNISAIDLARLSKLTIDRFPQYYDIYAKQTYQWRDYTQANRNPILGSVQGSDGLKTGHLEISGYGFTGSAVQDGVRRTIVINGLPSKAARRSEAERLMRLAFRSFETRTIAPETVNLPDMQVWLGKEPAVSVSLAQPITIAAHKRAFEKAKAEIVLDKALVAPVSAGDTVGRLVISMDGQELGSAPVIAESSSGKLGFWGKAMAGLGTFIAGDDDEG